MGAFVPDRAGIGRILKSAEMARAVKSATDATAANAEALTKFPIETHAHITDRAVGTVLIAHPAGASEQAKNGVLTKAASAAGLDVGGAR